MNKSHLMSITPFSSNTPWRFSQIGHSLSIVLVVWIALGSVSGASAREIWQDWSNAMAADGEDQEEEMVKPAEAESADPFAADQPLQLSMADTAAPAESERPAEGSAEQGGAQGEASGGAGEGGGDSASHIATQLSNPVGEIWALEFQYNINELRGRPFNGSRWQNNLNFQPVLPLHLTNDWNLIVRPVIPLLFYSPYPELKLRPGEIASRLLSRRFLPRGIRALQVAARGIRRMEEPDAISVGTDRYCGIGDIALVSMISPRKLAKLGNGKLLWGVGPTFMFPTADPTELGAGKYQAGPAAVIGYFDEKWIALVFAQQWWSFAGRDSKPNQNHMQVQYSVQYMLAPGLQVGIGAPIIDVDWNKDSRNSLTIPIGASIAKVFKIGELPVKAELAYYYSVVHPRDEVGLRNGIQIEITPVLPEMIKGNLLGD